MQQFVPSPSLTQQGFSARVVGPSRVRVTSEREVEALPLEKGLPLVVGEAPGAGEDKTGLAFHPDEAAGGLFTRLMERVGVGRERFNVVNSVWQRPPRNELYDADGNPLSYTREAVEYWKPALHSTIEELEPSVIVGLGKTALEVLTGFSEVEKTHGYVHSARIDLISGKSPCDCVGLGAIDPNCFLCDGIGVLEDAYSRKELHVPAVCTYHPAFLARGMKHLSGVFIRDVLAGMEVGEKGWHPPQLRVTPMPSPEQFRKFCEEFNPEVQALTADIETPNSRGLDEDTIEDVLARERVQLPIDRMSFCYSTESGGWSVPFEEPFLTLASGLISRAKRLRGWNWRLFDWPRLLVHGFATQAREYDLMDMWRHMHRTLPASVAFVAPFYLQISPYKHEAHSQPEWYSAMDAIVEHEIAEGMERDLRASGRWENYERHVVEIISTNHGVCTEMAKAGLPVDQERMAEFKLKLEGERKGRLERLQSITPEEVKVREPETGFKVLSKPVRALLDAGQYRGFVEKKAKDGKKRHWFTLELSPVMVIWGKLTKREKTLLNASGRDYEASEEVAVTRWLRKFDFNHNSPPQVRSLFALFGHKPKQDRKTKEDTTGEESLRALITRYRESHKASDQTAVECYSLIRECRAIDKVLGTYVNGWKPAADDHVHAIPGIWGDMYRISWRKPNLAATVADKKEVQIAAGFRECIACADDEVLIECDWASMEAVLVAHYAQDMTLMRLANLGTNAFIASHILKRPADLAWADEDLGAYLSAIKHDPRNTKVYDDAKHTSYLIAYGGTPFLAGELYGDPARPETLRQSFWHGLFELYYSLFDKVKPWQDRVMQEAHEKAKLVNPWGYVMPFWDVFQWVQKRWERLRELWVRFKTQGGSLPFTRKEQEWLDRIAVKIGAGVSERDAIASLCYDLGEEAKSALSFFPRDTGAAMLKDVLLALRPRLSHLTRVLRSCTHDAILAIAKRQHADEVVGTILEEMQRPWRQLTAPSYPTGLSIKAEAAIGQSWSKKAMAEWKGALTCA